MDYIDVQLIPFREKQYNCKHPSWRCSCCQLFKDNIMNDHKKELESLKAIIRQKELEYQAKEEELQRTIRLFNEELKGCHIIRRELATIIKQ